MLTVYSGVIGKGFQYASGDAVGRDYAPSPFSDSTLKIQIPYFKEHGIDLESLVPNIRWGTINVELNTKLVLKSSDYCAPLIRWTENEPLETSRLPPETVSFVRCCLEFDGYYNAGLLYYPHPETKPFTNRHNFDVLEVLTHNIPTARPGLRVNVICRAEAFEVF